MNSQAPSEPHLEVDSTFLSKLRAEGVDGDEAVMTLAIEVSYRALGTSSPNPPVGAVVISRSGSLVSTGATEAPGGRHAEIVALDLAGPLAHGGTLFVTLEPCNHHGRTGPCTRRIIAAGITRVVYAVPDSTDVARGGGAQLQQSKVDVTPRMLLHQARSGPLRGWLHFVATGRPLVTLKYAASLDGRVSAADGSSQWITGSAAREHAHSIRAQVDAILVGTGTLRADNPALTARTNNGTLASHQPLRCVMGLSEVPADSAVHNNAPHAGKSGANDVGFRHLRTRDPVEALAGLGDCLRVIVEGGPTVSAAFLQAGLVDEIDAYIAPLILGSGRHAVTDPSLTTLDSAYRFTTTDRQALGADTYLKLVVEHSAEAHSE